MLYRVDSTALCTNVVRITMLCIVFAILVTINSGSNLHSSAFQSLESVPFFVSPERKDRPSEKYNVHLHPYEV